MIVRPATGQDFPAWAAMRHRLWPDEDPAELEHELAAPQPGSIGLVAEEEGRLIGFAEAAVRSVAEGAPPGPAAYLEGIWVEPDRRRHGVGRALLTAVEHWARRQGLAWLGSDAVLDNDAGHGWHRRAGFAEIERLVVFGKALD
ncbi:MAG TPA: GNAT family N-acetyltransferase [Allosphingosinicella sp.]